MNRKIIRALSMSKAWILLLSLIWALLLGFDLLPILRGGQGWAWSYSPVLEVYRVGPLILGIAIYISFGLWLSRQRSVAGLLIWAYLGGIGLTLGAVHLRGDILYRLYSITVSGQATGWHMAAANIQNLSATLQNWPQFMRGS